MKKYEWMKHDPAGFMFSTINSATCARMIRFSCVLKDEEVDPERLKKASQMVFDRYPTFLSRSKPGFFWGYLEHSKKQPRVLEETLRPSVVRRIGRDGGPEIEILYYKRRITVEGNHILGDGTGFMELLKSIVAQYLVLGGMDKADFEGIRFADESPDPEEVSSPYYKYANEEKIPREKRENIYIIPKEYKESPYNNFIYGLMPVKTLLEQSRSRGMTITEYFATALIYSIIKNAKAPIYETILIAVPFNMRKFFPSESVRNFSNDVPVTFCPEGKTDLTFDEIAEKIKGQIKAKNKPEYHREFLNRAISLVSNPALRLIPFAIKHYGFNKIQKHTHKRDMTVMLSNMGNISLPPKMAEKVERFEFVPGDVRVYDLAMFCAAIGFGDYVNYTFAFSGEDASIPTEFFRVISENGVPIRIESSDENGYENCIPEDVHRKKCTHCNVEVAEEYTICPLCKGKLTATDEKLIDVKTSLYPQPYALPQKEKFHFVGPYFSFERVKAFFNF